MRANTEVGATAGAYPGSVEKLRDEIDAMYTRLDGVSDYPRSREALTHEQESSRFDEASIQIEQSIEQYSKKIQDIGNTALFG